MLSGDAADAREQYSISYRSPTPPSPGSRLLFFWWCRRCHRRYRLEAATRCLVCGVRFRTEDCRSLWFHVAADGRRSALVWNQRFRRPGSPEAAGALEQLELREIEFEAGVVARSDDDDDDESEDATRTREAETASASGGGGLVEGGDVPDAAGGRASYPDKLVN